MRRKHPWNTQDFNSLLRTNVSPALPTGDRELAIHHEKGRLDSVVETLLHLAMLTRLGIIKKSQSEKVSIGPARYQSMHSTDENQAAHRLPGQILIDGEPPSHWVINLRSMFADEDTALLIAARLNGLFNVTDDLPLIYNKVDSRLERNGLKTGFLLSARSVMECTEEEESQMLDIVSCAYQIYVNHAKESFLKSELRLAQKIQRAKNNTDSIIIQLKITSLEEEVLKTHIPKSLGKEFISYLESCYA